LDAEHTTRLLGVLASALGLTAAFAEIARRLRQPAVIGELLAGVVLGVAGLHWLDPHDPALHLLAELGVVLLLFEIGLETDLKDLLGVGGEAVMVALVGVALPFLAGWGLSLAFGLASVPAIVVGASLTATSVGITARVLSDLGRLQDRESRIVLGAAVIDDILGLVILSVVSGLMAGGAVTIGGMAKTTGLAFGFVAAALLVGKVVGPANLWLVRKSGHRGTIVAAALGSALGLAWLAQQCGSAAIIGAFAAGVVFAGTGRGEEFHHKVQPINQFLAPLFFAVVGASVDLRQLDPRVPGNGKALALGLCLLAVACATKYAAGYAPWWFKGDKRVVGVGMMPRGEVGLIFAQLGLAGGALSAGQFAAVALMAMGTTFIAPPLLRALLKPAAKA
jgi:Kef-type K+ transport system membrane component KefB